MRRIIAEWGMVLSSLLVLATALVWADSVVTRWSHEPLAVGPNLYLKSERGRICICSELGEDWKPRPTASGKLGSMTTHRYTNWTMPGIEYHYRLFTAGRVVWSLEIAMLLPIGFFLISTAVCWFVRPRLARGVLRVTRAHVSGNESR